MKAGRNREHSGRGGNWQSEVQQKLPGIWIVSGVSPKIPPLIPWVCCLQGQTGERRETTEPVFLWRQYFGMLSPSGDTFGSGTFTGKSTVPRFFTGIMLPESIQPQLMAFLPANEKLRLALPGQLHLTLSFHPRLSEEQADAFAARLATITGPPFQLRLAGTGIFKHDGGERGVLWASVQLSPALIQLHAAVNTMLHELGIPPESQPWVPHVSLARYSGGSFQSETQFREDGRQLSMEVTVNAFQLMQSTAGPRGSVYRPHAVIPLDGLRGEGCAPTPAACC